MPLIPHREALQSRLLFVALALSLALHGVAIIGTPRFDLAWPDQNAEPPLEVDIVAPLPPPEPRQLRSPRDEPAAETRPAKAPPEKAAKRADIPRSSVETSPSSAPAVESRSAHAESAVLPAAVVSDAQTRAAETDKPETPAYPLRAARLVFDLYYGESQTLVGEVVQRFELEGDRYVATSTAEAVGFVGLFLGGRYVQRSEGRLTAAGLVPERYTVKDRRASEPDQALFDWPAGVVRFHRSGRTSEAALSPGMQDPLSAVHQLHFRRPLEPGLLMDIATTRKAERMLFMNMGHDEVMTAAGPVMAVHVKRQDLDGEITEVWLDPARYFMPVRVYSLNRNGYVLEQVLREAEFEAQSAPASR